MKTRVQLTLESTPPSMRALAYVGVAFLVGVITQAIQALGAVSAHTFSDWHSYLISVIVAAIGGGLSAALPYLMAMLPTPPEPPKP